MPHAPNLPEYCVTTTGNGIVLSSTTTIPATFPVTVKGVWCVPSSTAVGYVMLIEATSTGTQRIKLHTGISAGGYVPLANGVRFNTAIYAELSVAKSATIVYATGS